MVQRQAKELGLKVHTVFLDSLNDNIVIGTADT